MIMNCKLALTVHASMVTYSDPHSVATIGSFYNLTPDTTYYFRLAAVNASGAGTMSDCVSQKTLAAVSGGLQYQDVEAGGTHDAGTEFAEGQSFSSGTQTFGANTKFNSGTEFAARSGIHCCPDLQWCTSIWIWH